EAKKDPLITQNNNNNNNNNDDDINNLNLATTGY
ncbi:hypothetical protein THAOC_20179, partial [Thalassiosira oceanica]